MTRRGALQRIAGLLAWPLAGRPAHAAAALEPVVGPSPAASIAPTTPSPVIVDHGGWIIHAQDRDALLAGRTSAPAPSEG